ncbi:AraC family transcriptional regulator [Sphingorhabdus sp. EL138]|uniref:AraC family transcriptional regulator n=1 Tax=Sphingorhabdus sp. EL138 TaxID=2073156 RepID=UPI000D68CA24|nr:AraC family transcriptional regulator [Sphingorhabdus sp. EL138]
MRETLPLTMVANLFDHLPDVVFFKKDIEGRYKAVNTTLVGRSGCTDKAQLIGRLPSEILGKQLGSSYEKQDRSVVRTGQPIEQRLEMHVYPNRMVGWCLTTKQPTFDDQRNIIGVVGISKDLQSPNVSRSEYDDVAGVIDWVLTNFPTPPSVIQMVERTGMSQFKLNRRFQQIYGLNVGQWIIKQRVDRAQRLLRETDLPIAEIALEAGYSDQSSFTRQFRQATNLTPKKFRKAVWKGNRTQVPGLVKFTHTRQHIDADL